MAMPTTALFQSSPDSVVGRYSTSPAIPGTNSRFQSSPDSVVGRYMGTHAKIMLSLLVSILARLSGRALLDVMLDLAGGVAFQSSPDSVVGRYWAPIPPGGRR